MFTSINEYKYHILEQQFKFFKSLDKFNETNTFEWDFTKDIQDNLTAIQKLNLGKDKIISYFKKFLKRLEKLPDAFKLKLFKGIVLSLLVSMTTTEIINTVSNYYNNDTELSTAEARVEINKLTDVVRKTSRNIKKEDKQIEYTTPTSFSDTLVNFLQHEEGDVIKKGEPVLTAYDIGDGMITIGYGHAERKSETKMKPGITKITEDEATDLLIEDIKEAQRGLDRILNDWKNQNIKPKITQNMYDAMVSMIYNMGIGNFRTSEFIQYVKKGNFDSAKEKIYTTNVTYPGHVTRRKKEALLFSFKGNNNELLKSLLT